MNSIPELLRANRERVQATLGEFLPKSHPHPDIQNLYDMMWDYPSRMGKGLRATLCLLMCEAFGGDVERAIPTASALELFQNWILIHDDIEDASDLRRGEPCLHKKYGVPLAINAGDALHCQMWRLLHTNLDALGAGMTLQVLQEYHDLIDAVVAGQHIELRWQTQDRWDISEQDYYAMCERKTASYTCITPCRLGALIAGEPPQTLSAFDDIGRALGLAFQLQDDVLNLVGDEARYGKEIAGDLWEGKRTLILIHLLEGSSSRQKREIQQILSTPRAAKEGKSVRWVLERMIECGSIKYARDAAMQLADDAKKRFDESFPRLYGSAARQTFLDLVGFVIEREY